ncbi:LppX_LprAFG lipoprotein [Streptomyces sp. NPDC004262]
MTRSRVCRVVLAIAVATALTGAAACTASSGPDPEDTAAAHRTRALAALRSAERSTQRARSVRVRSTTALGSLMSTRAEGALGWTDGLTGTLTITYTGGSTAELMRRLDSTSLETRYLQDAYYAKVGPAFARRLGGKHWIKYPYAYLATLGGGSGAMITDLMRNTTPNRPVRLLLAAGDVRVAGREQVSGRRTTHYTGTVSASDLDAGSELRDQLTGAGVGTETVDIWVDDQDLLVKKVEKAATANGAMTQTAYYRDYGVRVSAEQPPAADTEDFRTLLKEQDGTGPTS